MTPLLEPDRDQIEVFAYLIFRYATSGYFSLRAFPADRQPGDLTDLASLGLTLAEGKRLLAGVQQELVAAQARAHAVRRPECRSCDAACRVKDYRQHAIATLFGRVTVRLPRFRCAGCGTIAAGTGWPPHARSTPELDRLRAQLSALLTYRTAAEVLAQMFPVDAGTAHETLRRRTFEVAEELPMPATVEAATPAEMITVTLDSTFIRSCEAGRAAPGSQDRQRRDGDGTPAGVRRRGEDRHGSRGLDPRQPRRCRTHRGDGIERVHRRLSRAAAHPPRRWHRRNFRFWTGSISPCGCST